MSYIFIGTPCASYFKYKNRYLQLARSQVYFWLYILDRKIDIGHNYTLYFIFLLLLYCNFYKQKKKYVDTTGLICCHSCPYITIFTSGEAKTGKCNWSDIVVIPALEFSRSKKRKITYNILDKRALIAI